MKRIPSFLQWLVYGLIGIAFFTALFLIKGNGQPIALPLSVTASPSSSLNNSSTKLEVRNLLITLADDNRRVVGGLIAIRDQQATKLQVFNIDSHTGLDVDAQNMLRFRDAGFESSASQVQVAVEVASNIRVDGSLALRRLALAGLVDSVKGIDLDIPEAVKVMTQQKQRVRIPSGIVRLDGNRAAGYALLVVPGEAESVRIKRINAVLSATLAKLPKEIQRMEETISALGSLGRTTVPTELVAKDLVTLVNNDLWVTASYQTLPTTTSHLGAVKNIGLRRLSLKIISKQVATLCPLAVLPVTKGPLRVLVISNSGKRSLQMRQDIRKTDFAFVDGGQANVREKSTIRVGSWVSQAQMLSLLAAVKLPNAQIIRTNDSATKLSELADAVITVGLDYRAKDNKKESVN